MDDVLIFLNGSLSDSTSFNIILNLFCKATRMAINQEKSAMTTLGCSRYEIDYAIQRFPFRNLAFDEGHKYLGFHAKPNTYKIVDWSWLVAKIERELTYGIIVGSLMLGDLPVSNQYWKPLWYIGCHWHGSPKVFYPKYNNYVVGFSNMEIGKVKLSHGLHGNT